MDCKKNIRNYMTKERWEKTYSKYRYMEWSKDVTPEQYDFYEETIEECEVLDSLLWYAFGGKANYLNKPIQRRLKRFRRMKEKGKLGNYTKVIKKCKKNCG